MKNISRILFIVTIMVLCLICFLQQLRYENRIKHIDKLELINKHTFIITNNLLKNRMFVNNSITKDMDKLYSVDTRIIKQKSYLILTPEFKCDNYYGFQIRMDKDQKAQDIRCYKP